MTQQVSTRLDFNVVYNRALTKQARGDDESMTLEFVQHLVQKLTGWGYGRSYYGDRDAVPGKNIFTVLNLNVRLSSRTIVVVSPGFMKNSWPKYRHQRCFEFLKDDKNCHQLVVICLNVPQDQVPEDFANVANLLCFSSSTYKTTVDIQVEAEWMKLKMAFNGVESQTPIDIKTSADGTPKNENEKKFQQTDFSTKTIEETTMVPTATVQLSQPKAHNHDKVTLETFVSLTSAPIISLPKNNTDNRSKTTSTEMNTMYKPILDQPTLPENDVDTPGVTEVVEATEAVRALESQIMNSNNFFTGNINMDKASSSTEESEIDESITPATEKQLQGKEDGVDEKEHTMDDACSTTSMDSGVMFEADDTHNLSAVEDIKQPQPGFIKANSCWGKPEAPVEGESIVKLLWRCVFNMLVRPELAYQ